MRLAQVRRRDTQGWLSFVRLLSLSISATASFFHARLTIGGYTAFIEPLRKETDLGYRVRIGPELMKVTADKIRDELAKDVDIDGIVMRYP